MVNSYYITGGFGDRGGGNDGMVTQEDTIFVSGMDPSISEEEICQHFGAIGIIKVSVTVRKIEIFKLGRQKKVTRVLAYVL